MTCKHFIFQTLLPFLAKPICLAAIIAQAVILDYFLISHTSYDISNIHALPGTNNVTDTEMREPAHYAWYLWVVPDVGIIVLFIVSFVKSCQHFKKTKQQQDASIGIGGELPMGYVSWLVYSIVNATKIALIFRYTAQTLDDAGLFGPNLLKIGVCLAGVVFLTLVLTHHDADENDAGRLAFVTLIQHSVTTDILDTTEILQVILIQESHIFLSFTLHRTMIALACINLILPTILLIGLSKSRFGKSLVWQKRLTVIHKVFYVALVNLPLLVLRSVIWKTHKKTISVFLIKNSIALGIVVRTVAIHIEGAISAGQTPPETVEMTPLEPTNTTGDTPMDTLVTGGDGASVKTTPATLTAAGRDPKSTTFI